jgi:hypothetical protein
MPMGGPDCKPIDTHCFSDHNVEATLTCGDEQLLNTGALMY